MVARDCFPGSDADTVRASGWLIGVVNSTNVSQCACKMEVCHILRSSVVCVLRFSSLALLSETTLLELRHLQSNNHISTINIEERNHDHRLTAKHHQTHIFKDEDAQIKTAGSTFQTKHYSDAMETSVNRCEITHIWKLQNTASIQ